MKFSQYSRAVLIAWIAIFLLPSGIRGEEPNEIPVAEPISPSDPEPSVEAEPDSKPDPFVESVPINEKNPGAESGIQKPSVEVAPVKETSANPDAAGESGPGVTAVPMNESAANPDPAANADPVAESDPASTTNPEAEAVTIEEMVVSPNPAAESEAETSAEEILSTGKEPVLENPAIADRNEDGKLSRRERTLQNHREQLKVYDLNGDKRISEDEWKAANKENTERNGKFFMVDKDEDGKIDESEAVEFLMERISLSSTYIDATGDENVEIIENQIKEGAPSELRVTLFSIPLGD